MPGNKVITCADFIARLQNQRTIFTDQYQLLDAAEERKLKKAEVLCMKDDESLNQHLKKARDILTNIKKHLGDEVFVLCALATPPSTLGYSKLGKFLTDTEAWWMSVTKKMKEYHPEYIQRIIILKRSRDFGVLSVWCVVDNEAPGVSKDER